MSCEKGYVKCSSCLKMMFVFECMKFFYPDDNNHVCVEFECLKCYSDRRENTPSKLFI